MYSSKELKKILLDFCRLPTETEWVEFKEAKNNFGAQEIGKYTSAISNEANLRQQQWGWLIFGVSNNPPRKIVGTNYGTDKAKLEQLKHEIGSQTNGITFREIHELSLPEGRVVMFQIPAAPAGIPTSWKGHYYGRHGDSLVPLSIEKLESIRRQATEVDWTAEICPDATIDDLDEIAVQTAIERFIKKHPPRIIKDLNHQDPIKILEKAKLTRKQKITRAAILLLGKAEAAHHLNPNPCQITWKLKTEEEAYEHFGPPFLITEEEVFKRIRNLSFRFQTAQELIPIELTKYDSKIILEAINNCIAHQDYRQNARIIITEYTDRLVLQNAGEFFAGTVEDYVLREQTPDRYRNPFLVQAMVNLDMIDTMGMGIRRMFLEQRKRYFPLPEYDLSSSNHVKLTISGKIIDENYSNVLYQHTDLPLPEVLALDKIQKKKKIDKEIVKQLRKKGVVKGRYPNLYVSAEIAATTNEKAQFIKNKAFDDDYYEHLIIQFLDEYGSATRQDVNNLILDKLSETLDKAQKQSKVGNILTRMRKNEKIKNIGPPKKPKWVKTLKK